MQFPPPKALIFPNARYGPLIKYKLVSSQSIPFHSTLGMGEHTHNLIVIDDRW